MGMLTVIGALVHNLEHEMGGLQGATLHITGYRQNVETHGKTRAVYYPIGRQIVQRFKAQFQGAGNVGSVLEVGSVEGKYGQRKTRPNMAVLGVDHGYFTVEGTGVEAGRLFTAQESESTAPILLLGSRVASKLFNDPQQAIGEWVTLGALRFQVVGVLSAKSQSSMNQGGDDRLLVPYRAGISRFPQARNDYTLCLRQHPGTSTQTLRDAAEATLRGVRQLRPGQANNFRVRDNDEMLKDVIKSVSQVGIAAVIIALITLLGSSVGLTNIMLASVAERTREIGVRKALGAYHSTIRQQFLVESVMITVVGGAFGIVLGIGVGYLIALLMNIPFTMPWLWTVLSLVLCMGVGILSGYLPARRAARLDPILCLHHE